MYTIFSDGGSRGNPGESGIGISVNCNGKQIQEVSEYIGKYSNNVAEYVGAIRSLLCIKEVQEKGEFEIKKDSKIILAMDSKLVVEQLKGNWKIKEKNLQYLHKQFQDILSSLNITLSFIWVPRAENKKADELANLGIDKKIVPHTKIQEILENMKNGNTTIQNQTHSNQKELTQFDKKIDMSQALIAERVFFSKTSCLKFQVSKKKEIYMHIGALKESSWNWKIVKFNDMELSEMLFVLEGKKDKCAFFHNNSHNGANTKTQIWCAMNEKGFSIKISDNSKLLSLPEARVLQEMIKQGIWEINKL